MWRLMDNKLIWAMAFAASLYSQSALALRCDRALVVEGDVKFEVLRRCGEPYFVDAWEIPYYEGYGTLFMEEWSYNFGPTRLIRILRFRNGRLVAILTGEYGFQP